MNKIKRASLWGFLLVLVLTMVIGLGITGGLAQETKTIRVMIMANVPEDVEWKQIGLKPFLERNPHIKIEPVPVPVSEYKLKMDAMAAAGTLPDVVCLATGWFRPYEVAGLLLDLTPYVEKDKFDLEKAYFPRALELCYYKGGLYNLPYGLTTHVMYYNKTYFKEAGVAYPYDQYKAGKWDWETFLEAAKKLTVRDVRGKVMRFGYMQGWNWYKWAWMNGAKFVNPTGTKCLMNSPEMAEAIQWVANLANVHGIAPKPGELAGSVHEQFASGRSAMYDCIEVVIHQTIVPSGMDFDVAPMPEGKAGRACSFAMASFAVSAATQHPYEAYLVARHLGDAEWTRTLYEKTGYLQFPEGAAGVEFYLAHKKPPEHSSAFIEAMEYARADPFDFSPKAGEIGRIITSNLDLVWIGKKSAKDVLPVIEKEVDKLLGEK